MKRKNLVNRLKLAEGDFERIRKSVQDAELRTNGEIALAATSESSDYSFYELFISVVLGAVAFALLIPLYGQIGALLDRTFWHLPEWYLPSFYGIVSFAVIALFFIAANVPALDRVIIPNAAKHRAVYNRALRHFVESGVYGTMERTGILIFISYLEREVRIIADTGIASKIDQGEWDLIADNIALGVKNGNTADALVEAVTKCGDLLEKHFPAKKENPNELADGLFILEAGI